MFGNLLPKFPRRVALSLGNDLIHGILPIVRLGDAPLTRAVTVIGMSEVCHAWSPAVAWIAAAAEASWKPAELIDLRAAYLFRSAADETKGVEQHRSLK
jgi:hypothetical protein